MGRRTIAAFLSLMVVLAFIARPSSADETAMDNDPTEEATDEAATSAEPPDDGANAEVEPESTADEATIDRPNEDENTPEADAESVDESLDDPPADETRDDEPTGGTAAGEPEVGPPTTTTRDDDPPPPPTEIDQTGGDDVAAAESEPAISVRSTSLLPSIIPCPPLVPCPPDPLEPIAVDDAYTAQQGLPLSVPIPGVLGNDLSLTGQTLRVDSVSEPAHGTLTMTTLGGFVYFPDAGFIGTDTFTYRNYVDYGFPLGTYRSASATVRITVAPRPPTAVDDSYTTPFNTAIGDTAPGVLENDFDNADGGLTAELVSRPSHGIVILARSGGFSYAPDENFIGSDTFTYRAVDANGLSDQATVNIHVRPPELTANDDSYTTQAGTPLTVTAPGVLDNDEGDDPLSAQIDSDPQHGTGEFLPDGSFVYTPDDGFVGTDSFVYRAVHVDTGWLSNLATVTIHVANTAPTALDDAYATTHDAELAVEAPGVLANDSDTDGDAISASLVTAPEHGMLSFVVDGSFTYTPNPGFVGADSFTYRTIDRHFTDSATATVTIEVTNDTPTASDDDYSGRAGEPLTVDSPGVLANDSDVDDGALTAEMVSEPANGDLSLAPDGSFTYMPDAGFSGTDSFTYQAVDTIGAAATATVFIDVRIRATSLALDVTPNPARDTGSATLAATVVPHEPTDIDPTGTVEFFVDEKSVGTGTLSSPATIRLSDLEPGTYEVTAHYGGDAIFAAAEADPVILYVELGPTPDVGGDETTVTPDPTVQPAPPPVVAPADPARDTQVRSATGGSRDASRSPALSVTGGGPLPALSGFGLVVSGLALTALAALVSRLRPSP